MARMTRKFVEGAITKLGWQPYIVGSWIEGLFGGRLRRGDTITFRDHEEHRYNCSPKNAQEILALAKKVKASK